tara:strand:+ start:106 stop:618 length:513 start_codon:yes stop_codon:yes gene_type:complete
VIKQDILENHPKPVYLGIGSNIGNRITNINKACHLLTNFCSIIKISKFYESNSWPNENFPKYLNIIIKCNTVLKPILLLKNLKNIETSLGRKKNEKNFPRTCDIDIIDFKGLKQNDKFLQIPHPRMLNRNFVLFPLFEIEKNWKHPKNNISIDRLLKKLDLKSLRSIKIY